MEKEESFKKVYIYALIFILVLFAVSFIYYFSGKNKANTNNQIAYVNYANNQNNWQTYESDLLGFSIQYPSDWQIEEAPHYTDGVVDRVGGLLIYQQNEGASKRYQLSIFKEDNLAELSSQKLAQDFTNKSEDSRIQQIGQVNIGIYEGYGVTNVFAGDGLDEELFFANGTSSFTFIYPIKENNENYFNPIENYDVTERIIQTFKLL